MGLIIFFWAMLVGMNYVMYKLGYERGRVSGYEKAVKIMRDTLG